MRTEKAAEIVAVGSNALANSVVLVCRKRNDDWENYRAEFIRQLKAELPKAVAI